MTSTKPSSVQSRSRIECLIDLWVLSCRILTCSLAQGLELAGHHRAGLRSFSHLPPDLLVQISFQHVADNRGRQEAMLGVLRNGHDDNLRIVERDRSHKPG